MESFCIVERYATIHCLFKQYLAGEYSLNQDLLNPYGELRVFSY